MDPSLLTNVPLFDGLSELELRTVSTMFEEKSALMGDRLTDEDDFGYSFFVVLDGRLRVEIDDTTTREIVTGDFFGEVALVTGSRRTASVIAAESCRLARMMSWDFRALMEASPVVAERLTAAAAERASES